MTETERPRIYHKPRIVPRRNLSTLHASYPFHLDQIPGHYQTTSTEDMTIGDDVRKHGNKDFLYKLVAD